MNTAPFLLGANRESGSDNSTNDKQNTCAGAGVLLLVAILYNGGIEVQSSKCKVQSFGIRFAHGFFVIKLSCSGSNTFHF